MGSWYTQNGFTLLEVMLVIAALGVIAGIAVPVTNSFVLRSDLQIARDNVVSALANARERAHYQIGDSQWGVRVAQDGITLFEGDSYATRNEDTETVFPISPAITLSGTQSFVFSRLDGDTQAGSLTLETGSGSDQEVTIEVNENGIATIQ